MNIRTRNGEANHGIDGCWSAERRTFVTIPHIIISNDTFRNFQIQSPGGKPVGM